MFILKQILKLIKLLHTDEGTFALALGFSLSLFPSLSGFTSFLGLISLLIVLVFRVQMGAYFLGAFFFSLLSTPFLNYFHQIGLYLLQNPELQNMWTHLYQNPLAHWLKFNHTQVLGGQIVSLILFPFAFLTFNYLILKYKNIVVLKFKNSKIYNYFSRTSIVIGYNNLLDGLKG